MFVKVCVLVHVSEEENLSNEDLNEGEQSV